MIPGPADAQAAGQSLRRSFRREPWTLTETFRVRSPMPSSTLSAILATLVLALPGVSAADSRSAPAGARRCLERPLPKHSSAQTVQIHSIEGDEIETTITARVLWKRLDDGRHGGLIRLLDPPEVAGMSALVREREPDAVGAEGARGTEIFLYLPELRRVRRVSVHQATMSLFGTAFSYADFDRLQGYAKTSLVETRGEVRHEGRRAYLVEAVPPASDSTPYTKISSWIDAETCLPLRVEYYDSTGELTKLLIARPKDFERVKGIWIARSITMHSLADGVKSRLDVQSIEIDEALPDEAFTPANLAEEF